jgi:hypothetical protein
MKNIILILTLFISASNATNLLTYNIYERSDRVDLMLSFDSPYEGKIIKKRGQNITTLILSDLTYDKLVEKSIDSNILQAITIEPNKDKTNVVLKSKNNIGVIASKTVDGFGLRIRTKQINSTSSIPTIKSKTKIPNQKTFFKTKESENLIDIRYVLVIAVLLVMVIFMFWIKRRVQKTNLELKDKNSWLFKKTDKSFAKVEVHILHKKQIDNTNSVVLLEFEGNKYLVMTGNSNLLLEKFGTQEIKDSSDFEKAFEENRKKLDEYLKLQNESEAQDYKSKLERY